MARRAGLVLATLVLVGLAHRAAAEDHVILSDGRELSGLIIRDDANEVHLAQGTAVQVLPRSLVKRVEYAAPSAVTDELPKIAPAAPATVAPGATTAVTGTPAAYPALRPGSVLVLRTSEDLDAERDRKGREFTAVLVEAAVIDGVVVLPAGTTVLADLHASLRGGRLFGRSVLEIGVIAILIDGKRLPCTTDVAVARGSSATANTLEVTATSTVIGAIIDGEHGAVVGAVGGVGLSLLTRPDAVHLPLGSVLDVRLTAPFQR